MGRNGIAHTYLRKNPSSQLSVAVLPAEGQEEAHPRSSSCDGNSEQEEQDQEDNRAGGEPSQAKPGAPNEHQLAQRQKQVDFGKNTLGYHRYVQAVPRLVLLPHRWPGCP